MKHVRILSALLLTVATLLLIGLCFQCGHTQKTIALPEVEDYEQFLGLRIDTLVREEGVLQNGWTLSNLLQQYDVSPATTHGLIQACDTVLNLKQLRSGQSYYAFLTPDSLSTMRYLIYQQTATDFVIFDIHDSLSVYKRHKPVHKQERNASGIIQQSLWHNVNKNGFHPELTYHISDLFAWQVDFFAIQEGDQYQIIYEELVVDDSITVGIGAIKGAAFRHNGKTFYAIPFIQDSTLNYYDENGNNLRKAFLKAPLKYARISSRFSHGRMHPILRIRRPHHGVDYAAPSGTPIVSIGQGRVVAKGYERGGGNYIKIKHNQAYVSTYMHLSRFAAGIHPGAQVEQGQRIGYVGSTGLSTGPHLDFRIHQNGKPVDPLKLVSPPVDALKPEYRDSFEVVKSNVMKRLQSTAI